MDALAQLSIALTNALQGFSPALDTVMKTFSYLGSTEFYLVLIPLLYWNVDSRVAIRSLMALVASEYAVSATKQLFRQPRPYWASDVAALSEEPTYGLPSGHSANSFSFWGYLVRNLKEAWVKPVAVFLIVMVGLSRIYLGVHYVHDVIGGWLLALLLLWAFARFDAPASAFVKKQSLGMQIAMFAGIALVMIALGFVISANPLHALEPVAWAEFATEAHSPKMAISLAGTLFGGLTGYALMRRYANFSNAGNMGQKALRYAFGVLGVTVLFFGLDAVFASIAADETALGYVLRFVRYATVAMWVTHDYPWLALKAKLFTRLKRAA
jgi:membrane-associated phospholipid phosphatase